MVHQQHPPVSPAIEDYAKAIYALEQRGGPVSTTALAERPGVTPASASGMVKRLCELGLVEHEPNRRLTSVIAYGVAGAITLMNLFLISQQLF